MGISRSMSALTSLMVVSWSGRLHVREGFLELPLPGVSGPKAWPREAIRAEYSRMSSPAISLTALRALDLVLAQSAPPILLSTGVSPPT